MRRRDQRLMMIGAAGAVLVLAAALTFAGLRDSVVYFVSPSELAEKAAPGQRVRLGGLVVEGTLRREPGGVTFFTVTDGAVSVVVRSEDELPDLFREGQGVIAEGSWTPGAAFEATRILAKHDENYVPRELADTIKHGGAPEGGGQP